MKVIVHPGFPKTGTTSLQHLLAANRALLAPYLEVCGPGDMRAVKIWGRRYARHPNPLLRARFRAEVRKRFAACRHPAALLVSYEGLVGPTPASRVLGRRVRDFHSRAVPLLRVIFEEARARWGAADTELHLLLTTRSREAWIRSNYTLLLRLERIRDDFERFRARHDDLMSDLGTEAARIAAAFPDVPCTTVSLEQAAAWPAGPAQAVLALAEVPGDVQQRLALTPPSNTALPAALRDELLHLNRSNALPHRLRKAKYALVRRHKRQAAAALASASAPQSGPLSALAGALDGGAQ